MGGYQNFTVDFAERLASLDKELKTIAYEKNLEVSYLLMKLSAAFLLPYERIEGDSGSSKHDISDKKEIRKYLELDKKIKDSSYCLYSDRWLYIYVDNFSQGPRSWYKKGFVSNLTVAYTLRHIRNAIAHSNLYFGGEYEIQHIFFGKRNINCQMPEKYSVIQCSVEEVSTMVDAWISNVKKLRTSPSLIWEQIDSAA